MQVKKVVDAVKQEKNATRGNVGNENMDENVDDPPPILVMTKKYSTAMCYISTGVLPNARAKSNKEKVKIERLLSAEEKVEPVKSKTGHTWLGEHHFKGERLQCVALHARH